MKLTPATPPPEAAPIGPPRGRARWSRWTAELEGSPNEWFHCEGEYPGSIASYLSTRYTLLARVVKSKTTGRVTQLFISYPDVNDPTFPKADFTDEERIRAEDFFELRAARHMEMLKSKNAQREGEGS